MRRLLTRRRNACGLGPHCALGKAILASLLACIACLPASGRASESELSPEIVAMQAQLAQLTAELRQLREQGGLVERLPPADDEVEPLPAVQVAFLQEEPPGLALPGAPRNEPGTRKKLIEFPSVKLTGFTQLDGVWYSQTPNNMATVGNAQNAVGFRRARLAVFGKVAEFTNYIVEMDFATAGHPSFFDVFVEQTNLPPFLGAVRAGQYVQPFSVDAMSGFRNLPFLERSLPFLAFVPFRRVGIEAYSAAFDKRLNWANSVFKTGGFNNAPLGDDQFAVDTGDVGGYSYSGRVTYLIDYDDLVPDRYLWHIGAAFDYSRLGQNTAAGSGASGNSGGGPSPFYESKVLPEFGPLGNSQNPQSFGPTGTSAVNGTPIFVDSGRYAAKSFELYGVETVWQRGSVSFQSEWMATVVNSVVGPVFYNGAYAEVMWRPTGEHRAYDKITGALKNPVPFTDFIPLGRDGIRGWGAWEVAARLSYVHEDNPGALNGHYYNSTTNTFNATGGNVGNGQLTDTTLGLTWMLNAHTKLQFNWIHCMLHNVVRGYSDADLFVTRAQVDF